MPSYLCLSIHFLDPAFHGRTDGGAPEWPPSPLRVYQALVAASAARWGERHQVSYARPALRWLEEQPHPAIVAPEAVTGSAYRLSVPNNAMDLVGRAWSRGNTSGKGDASPATHRAMKTVRPARLGHRDTPPAEAAVHYLWELPDSLTDEIRGHIETLKAGAGSIVALGWGVDLVAGSGRIVPADEADRLSGERWRPTAGVAADGLRVPTHGTLDALVSRHGAFLSRLDGGTFTPVPALTTFAVVGYRRATDPAARPFAAFELWQPADKLADLPPGKSKFRPFDQRQGAVTVAAMVRHAVGEAARAAKRGEEWINTFIHGHTPDGEDHARSDGAGHRFAYLPLPSLEARPGTPTRHAGSVRRVLVVGPPGGGAEVEWVRRALSGRELIDESSCQPQALLCVIPDSDRAVRAYSGPREGSSTWSTVTPVVLPGFDDRDAGKAEGLLRKAITQAGLSSTLANNAELEWRCVGFLPGLDVSTRYKSPGHLRDYPRYHVRLQWRDATGRPVKVRGPVVIGGGRYCGLGLFAPMG